MQLTNIKDIDNIIHKYINQLELTQRYNKVINEINNLEIYVNYNGARILKIHKVPYLICFIFDMCVYCGGLKEDHSYNYIDLCHHEI